MSGFFTGINYFFKGFSLAMHEKIRLFVIVPLIINFAVFSILLWFIFGYLQTYIDAMIPSWLDWEIVRDIISIVIGLALIFMSSFIFAMFANIIAAPFNAILSEKVEHFLTNTPPPSTGRHGNVISSYIHAISSQIHKLFYSIMWSIPLLILFFIPPISFIAPVLWLLFGAWMLALEYIDYPANNHEILFKQQRELLRKHRGTSLGFGTMAMIFSSIPIVNLIVMPVSVVAMTALYVDKLNPNKR